MAKFEYFDVENNPENVNSHIYNWHRANNHGGLSGYTLIGSNKYYTISTLDEGKYLSFDVELLQNCLNTEYCLRTYGQSVPENQNNWMIISYEKLLLKKLKINMFKMDVRTFW